MPEPHVSVVDARLPESFHSAAEREAAPGPSYYVRVDANWSMDRIARRVLEYCPRGVGVVRLCCHGNSGAVELGQGLTPATAQRFGLLRGHFIGSYPRIEVHACAVLSQTAIGCAQNAQGAPVLPCTPGTVARAGPGHVIMQALADATGVLVIAAFNAQVSDPRIAFEGPVQHFRPAQP